MSNKERLINYTEVHQEQQPQVVGLFFIQEQCDSGSLRIDIRSFDPEYRWLKPERSATHFAYPMVNAVSVRIGKVVLADQDEFFLYVSRGIVELEPRRFPE